MNMIDKLQYANNNIIYISNYMYNTDKLYSMSAQELFKEYYPSLRKINKDFNKEDIIELKCFDELYAQPIITTNYSEKIIEPNLNAKGVYMATMAQIYPKDRGMNYAVRKGYEVANMIIKENV